MRGTGLVLVVGPSGAGKDSVMDGARARLGDQDSVRFVRRFVTRPLEAGGERHRSVTSQDFEGMRTQGRFALTWSAHGLRYAIPAEIDDWLAEGKVVVANVSRAVVAAARRRYPGCRIVLVTASPEIRAARLAARERESPTEQAGRLARDAEEVTGPDVTRIDNDADLAQAVAAFLTLLNGIRAETAR